MSGRPDPEEWSGEEYGLQFPDGTPLLLAGKLQAGARDASTGIRPTSGLSALHAIVASGGYVAAACDSRIIIDATATISASDTRLGVRCRRPACAALFDTARSSVRPPAPSAAVPGPSVFRCTECGHGGSLQGLGAGQHPRRPESGRAYRAGRL